MKHARSADADLVVRLLHGVADAVVDGMSTTQRVAAAAIAGVFALTPFGAWDPVVTEPEPLGAGEAIEVGPFELTVVRAEVTDELGFLTPQEGNRLLAVVVDVTNVSDRPEYGVLLARIFPTPTAEGIAPRGSPFGESAGSEETTEEPRLPDPTILAADDGTNLDSINPGISYRVALVWEQQLDQAQDEVTLDVAELTWIEEDTTFGMDDQRWFAYGEVLYRGPVTVQTGADR